MAKRYIKIGWENKPSVKTPVNMTNLGRMDKGIDDCDNAIEEIYAKRVNNVVTTNEDTFLAGPVGKVLQDQVTELNKNLRGTEYASSTVSLADGYSFISDRFKAKDIGGRVIVYANIQISSGNIPAGLQTIFTLPSGTYPSTPVFSYAYLDNESGNNSVLAPLIINYGVVQINVVSETMRRIGILLSYDK